MASDRATEEDNEHEHHLGSDSDEEVPRRHRVGHRMREATEATRQRFNRVGESVRALGGRFTGRVRQSARRLGESISPPPLASFPEADRKEEDNDALDELEYVLSHKPAATTYPGLISASELGEGCVQDACQMINEDGLRRLQRGGSYRTGGRVFCCSFSPDGETLCFASQDFIVHLIDTNTWKPIKHVEAVGSGWSVIDIAHSPDRRFVAYSGWSRTVHLVNVDSGRELHEPVNVAPPGVLRCMFGIEFDPTSRFLVAACSGGSLYVYDFESQARVFGNGRAHDRDINDAIFFDSPYVMISGSDDALVKMWDRRESTHGGLVGGFIGHHQGMTCVASKGDGRYVLSNSKDNSMKLWDARLINKPSDVDRAAAALKSQTRSFDYRHMAFDRRRIERYEHDRSVMTYVGHHVQRTLIRANFSPTFSTNNRYVYSGDGRGNVYIWNTLTGEKVKEIDGHYQNCCRGVSWHPYEPCIVSSGWDRSVIRWEVRPDDEDPRNFERPMDLVSGNRGWW